MMIACARHSLGMAAAATTTCRARQYAAARPAFLHVLRSASLYMLYDSSTISKPDNCSYTKIQLRGLKMIPSRTSGKWTPRTSYNHGGTGEKRKNRIILMRQKVHAQKLMDRTIHQTARFKPEDFQKAHRILKEFKRQKSNTVETVNDWIGLMERLCIEVSKSPKVDKETDAEWLLNPGFIKSFISNWMTFHKNRAEGLISPSDVVSKLQNMSIYYPEVPAQRISIPNMLESILENEEESEAPLVADELLETLRSRMNQVNNPALMPNEGVYNQVLLAWSRSGRKHAPQRIEELLGKMKKDGVHPDSVSYGIIISLWIAKGDIDTMERWINIANEEGVKLSPKGLSRALYGYAKVGSAEKADGILQQLLSLEYIDERRLQYVEEGVQYVMLAYRKIVDSKEASIESKRDALARAEKVFNQVTVDRKDLKLKNLNYLFKTMREMYTMAGERERIAVVSPILPEQPVNLLREPIQWP